MSGDPRDGMNPAFLAALDTFFAAAPGNININSGYRSPERQAVLFADAVTKYGSEAAARKWVAPPGHSMHNKGGAADLGYASPEVQTWAHENAAKFGLNFRMAHEPWHIEMLNGQPVAVPPSGAPTGAPPDAAPGMAPLPPPSPPGFGGMLAALRGGGPDVAAPEQTELPAQNAGLIRPGATAPNLAQLLSELQNASQAPVAKRNLPQLLG